MPAPGTFRVFLSSVTQELGSYRAEVARVLRRKEIEIREQEHFRQGPATLLEQLRDYIEHCDAVILLVGERCGGFPTEEHIAALGQVPCVESYRTSSGQMRASYTQWELFLAKHYGKKTYVFLSAPGFEPTGASSEDAGPQSCQAAYRAWVTASGEHYDSLTTKEKLIEDVLVLPFPDLHAPKPVSLPFSSLGPRFHGREEMLSRLRERLDRRTTAIQAVHGLGGVGKTRLAIEYAWRSAAEYSALLFVGAGSPADLRRNLAALCGRNVLNLPEQEATEEEVRESAVLRWLGQQSGWLLILDNVDSEDAASAVDSLVAQLHGGHVLLTGRLARWSAELEPLELGVLTEEAATGFLLARTAGRRRATNEDGAQAHMIARELGDLPLALEQAGAYIAERRLTLAAYLTEWQARHDQVLAWFDPRVSHYPASVAVTWQTSFDRLSAPARRLLERLAWLGPEPIPESLLDVPIPGLPEPEANLDPRGALVELETYSLVTRAAETPTLTVHRLVQDVTRRNLRDDLGNGPLTEALRWVNAAFVGDPEDVRTWPTLDPLASHSRAVVSFADAAGLNGLTARLMNDLGLLLLSKALVVDAEPLIRRALAIDEKTYGTEHPTIVSRLNNLGQLLKATSRLGEAETVMRRALTIGERGFGPEDPEIATALTNLAALLLATNRLIEAEPLMRRALAIDEKNYGPEHPSVAVDLSNLAQLLQDTTRLAEAERLMRRALAIDEKHFGRENPFVAIRLNNLAALLNTMKRPAEAEPLIAQVAQIFERSLGKHHPNVAAALNNQAQLLKSTNRLAEAEPLMARALTISLGFERRTGHELPHRGDFLENYKGLLRTMGKSDSEIEATIESLAQSLK